MFTSDNGYFLGEHRMRQGKIWTHEPSLRVPFVVTGPGVPHGTALRPDHHRGHHRDHPGPRRRAARPIPPTVSRCVPVLRRATGAGGGRCWSRTGRRPELRRCPGQGVDRLRQTLTGTALRTARWKYVRYIDGDAELYDLTRDPNELDNVYGRRQYAGVQAELARVWKTARDCAGATCRASLPAAPCRWGPDRSPRRPAPRSAVSRRATGWSCRRCDALVGPVGLVVADADPGSPGWRGVIGHNRAGPARSATTGPAHRPGWPGRSGCGRSRPRIARPAWRDRPQSGRAGAIGHNRRPSRQGASVGRTACRQG